MDTDINNVTAVTIQTWTTTKNWNLTNINLEAQNINLYQNYSVTTMLGH